MRLPPPSAFASDRALRRAALVVAVVVGAVLLAWDFRELSLTVGDPDDALRLSIVRDLAHGRGWFDQRVTRLQPPYGTFMHWSRLLDGGLALTMRLIGEFWMRALWPLAWIAPAALAVLAMARRLASEPARGLAVLVATALLVVDLPLYGQFSPGRIDHHDVQITLCLLALAGAMGRGTGVRGPLGAGLASGLGLAIGLEALPFEAAIGAGLALEFVCDPNGGRRARAYGLGLAGAALLCFLVQTPPARWSVSACDALGLNLVLALAAAGGGLFAAASLTAERSWRTRLVASAAAGVGALIVYLALRPACLHGAFAEVDPRLRPFWFDHISELAPIGHVLARKPLEGVGYIGAALIGLGALVGLVRLRRREGGPFDPVHVTLGLCLLLAAATGFAAERMSIYILWFAVAPTAALVAEAVVRSRRSPAAIARRAGLAAATLAAIGLTLAACGVIKTAELLPDPPDRCFDAAAYAVLARQPPGVTLGETDLGSYVLAHTPSAALSAPYHRMAWGDLAAHAALAAPADRAQTDVGALKATYVLECRAHHNHFDRVGLPSDALQRRLDAGRPPAWLTPLSPPGSALEVYRVSTLH